MWNVQNGSLELSCAHSSSEYVLSCDVSQDDKRLLSASVDRYAKVTNYCEGTVKLEKKTQVVSLLILHFRKLSFLTVIFKFSLTVFSN